MPIHFLWGDEDYLIEKAFLKIRKDAIGDDINELNYRYIDNPSFAVFSEVLRTPPMMFGASVVKLKVSNYFLETKGKQKLDDKQTQELTEGFKNVCDNVHIVMICQTPQGAKKKPDSRKKIYKELVKVTKPVEFQSYKTYEEYKLIPIIKKMAAESGLKIADKEASLIIQTTGAYLRDISNVLEKIKLTIYPNDIVTSESIEQAASNNADIFALVDLVLKKDWASSLSLISNILSKEHYLPSLAFIQTTFTNLLKLKIYSKKFSSYDLAVQLNQNEFVVKKNLEKIRNVQLEELVRLKLNLTEIEFLLKTGVLTDALGAYEIAFLKGAK